MSIVVPPAAEFWQGDLFGDAPWGWVRGLDFVTPSGELRFTKSGPPAPGARGHLVVRGGIGMGMLISHECVVDKQQPEPLAFARVVSLGRQSERVQEQIRSLRQYSTFYLPTVEGLIEESYVDFRLITALDPGHLPRLTRIASLSEAGRAALREQLIRHWTHPGMPR